MIQVLGHKNPDSDSICSALSAEALLKDRGLDVKAVRQGELNRETRFILENAGVEAPEMCGKTAGEKIWLVDFSDQAQGPDDMADAEIVGLFDHHRLGDIITTLPPEIWVWPVGCSCTVIFNVYQIENRPITKPIAMLMMSAILSDTVGFASPTCTEKDKEAVKKLADIAGVTDLDGYIKKLLIAKTDIEGLSAAELVEKDLKAYPFAGRDVVVGQIELATLEQVDGIIEELEAELEARCARDNLAFASIMLTDITTSTTRLLFKGEWAKKLDPFVVDGKLMMKSTLSRKKQGWPWLQSVLK